MLVVGLAHVFQSKQNNPRLQDEGVKGVDLKSTFKNTFINPVIAIPDNARDKLRAAGKRPKGDSDPLMAHTL